jgi:hypothetical protein
MGFDAQLQANWPLMSLMQQSNSVEGEMEMMKWK